MSRHVVTGVVVSLASLHLGHDALLSVVGSAASPGSVWLNWHLYYLGIVFSQAAILATWVVWSAQPSYRIFLASAFLTLCAGLAAIAGIARNESEGISPADFAMGALPFLQFGLLTLTYWLLRRCSSIRIHAPAAPAPVSSRQQISLQALLGWTALLAIALACFSVLIRNAETSSVDLGDLWKSIAVSTVAAVACTVPVCITILIVLGGPAWLAWVGAILFVGGLLLVTLIGLWAGVPRSAVGGLFRTELVILLTTHASAILTTIPLGLLGYRAT